MRHGFVLFQSQHCPLQDYAVKNPPAVQTVPGELKQDTSATESWIKKTKYKLLFFVFCFMLLLLVHMNERKCPRRDFSTMTGESSSDT